MVHLEKLKIQGFRSFGPHKEDRAIMNFVKENKEIMSLILILGQNGCGKTTIIEVLRYVTTGDSPPGSDKGKSFIHDPKLAGENTVVAKTTLTFVGVDERRYRINRILQATQKAKNCTLKTVDNSIDWIKDDDSVANVSGKCADINKTGFIYLGVSKAVLNYVIFCHQEDSNWPLEEGSKVSMHFSRIYYERKKYL